MMRTTFGAGLIAAIVAACSFGTSNEPSTGTGVDAGNGSSVTPTAKCGDGVCSATEVNSCPQDCGPGGNGSGTPDAGTGGGGGGAICGNSICETGETNATCPLDCTSGGGGGGGGTLDCSMDPDETECVNCVFSGVCDPGYDANSCLTCLLGP